MKYGLINKYLPAIFILLNAFVFSSCRVDVDTNSTSTLSPLEGMYKTRGLMYNYNGRIAGGWTPNINIPLTDTVSVPPGYISRVDLSLFSPKTATVIDSVSATIPFANFLSSSYHYYWKMNTVYTSITYSFSPVMTVGYSYYFQAIPHFTAPSSPQKLTMRLITYYNDQPGFSGNDHIVDEIFEQQ